VPSWQALTIEQAHMVFHDVIRPSCTIWVGVHDQQVVAYLALKESHIDQLYVDPSEWRKGWGTRLIAVAKTFSPQGLELHTHQANQAARRLYEAHGFRAVAFGISPPPEALPDVEYHWHP
jgi:ribosomal protein S18 acetylase RimI-like enzyme